jgi:lipopolysaccharide export system ATP-binding protein
MAREPGAPSRRGLEIRGLSRSFGRREVVRSVDLTARPGRVTGLLGPNGAGKTTIFRMVVGLLRPTAGTVHLDGRDITAMPVHRRARHGLAYLAQAPSIFRGLTVRENLLTALELAGRPRGERDDEARRLIAETGLEAVADQRGATLSGGERRRAEIARALCARPSVLILDEPFAAIDPRMAAELADQVAALRTRGVGLLLTDHGARQLLPLCDEVNVLVEGSIAASGAVEDVVRDPLVRERYLGEGFDL